MKTALRVLSAETLSNIRSYLALTMTLVILSFSAGMGITLATGFEASGIEKQYRELKNRGADVLHVQSKEVFDSAQCDDLRNVPGVADAGAALERWDATIPELPGSSVKVVRATAGYVRIIWNQPNITGTVGVGSEVSSALGIRTDMEVSLRSQGDPTKGMSLAIGQVFPNTARQHGANQEIVITDWPHGQTSECFVEADPGAKFAVEQLLMANFNDAAITVVLKDIQVGNMPEQQLQHRISLWIPMGAAGAVVILAAICHFGRRADWALYALLGVRASGIVFMVVAETMVTIWLPFAVGATAGLSLLEGLKLTTPIALSAVTGDLICTILLLLAAPAAALLLLRGNTTDRLKGQ